MCKECKEVEMNDEVEQEKEFSIEDLSREELIETVYNLLSTKEKEIDLDNSVIAESDSFQKVLKKRHSMPDFIVANKEKYLN